MSARCELTDAEWALLQPLLPKDPRQGGRWRDHRTVISGVLFRERLRLGTDIDDPEWTLGIDSSVIRAYQHAAGARRQPPVEQSKR